MRIRGMEMLQKKRSFLFSTAAFLIVFAAVGSLNAGLCDAKLLALDMGSDTTKIALVKPGRSPVTLVTNEMSKRKTPTKVAFNQGARLFGEAAAGIEQRYPQKVFSRVRDALGQSSSSKMKDMYESSYRPYKLSENDNDGTVLFEVESGDKYSPEELTGMLLEYYASLGTEFAESSETLRDVAIVIPSYFGIKERRALVNAAKIADIKILGFINTASAAALHYAKDKDFLDSSEEIIFFNMGHAYSEASLIRFSAFQEARTSRVITNIEVVDSTYNAKVGSESFDVKLTNYFADKYQADKGVDLRQSGKSMSKLKTACKKTKEVLSANTATPVNVESIYEDDDFREKITREKFEELIEEDIERIVWPLIDLLEKTKVDIKNLTAVELLGGGSRVPAVQKKLSEALGGRHLDRHLDGDEAAVMGAALFAANYSKSFVLKKMHLYEKFLFPLEAEVSTDSGVIKLPDLLEFSNLPGALPIKVKNPKQENLRVNIKYSSDKMPPRTFKSDLCTYEIEGLKTIDEEKYNLTDTVTMMVSLDVLGSLSVEEPTILGEYWEYYNKTIQMEVIVNKTDEANSTTNSTTAEEEAADLESPPGDMIETEPAAESEKTEEESKEESKDAGDSPADEEGEKKKKKKKVSVEEEMENEEWEEIEKVVTKKRLRQESFALNATSVNTGDLSVSAESLKLKALRLKKLKQADEERKLAEEAKNKLETFILQTMTMCNDEDVEAVSTEEEREKIKAELMDAEDWLYSDGENANHSECTIKNLELEQLYEPVAIRLHEMLERPDTIKNTYKKLEEYKDAMTSWEEKKPWIPVGRLQNATKDCEEMEAWLKEQVEAQSALKPFEDPILKSSDIEQRLKVITKEIRLIQKTPKPKDKKKKVDGEAAADANSTAKANATAEGAKGEEKGEEPKKEEISHDELR
eukprot:CAMPEP_0197471714 /NCGR_PEP_ID=MMETSP1309-20131121/2670_1 /TAXON_ID=464262 /ORGANISM="Genus nov. species nov., Strain RCC998" /LENGTH=923 /DNA_ID=CAMNT_0043009637 /DNA_START=74 /DNA_END=2845 /DNA_ORIENTATION=+